MPINNVLRLCSTCIKEINATGTELLDLVMSRLRTARTVEKDRCKLEGISLRPEAPNEPGVEQRTKWNAQLVLR